MNRKLVILSLSLLAIAVLCAQEMEIPGLPPELNGAVLYYNSFNSPEARANSKPEIWNRSELAPSMPLAFAEDQGWFKRAAIEPLSFDVRNPSNLTDFTVSYWIKLPDAGPVEATGVFWCFEGTNARGNRDRIFISKATRGDDLALQVQNFDNLKTANMPSVSKGFWKKVTDGRYHHVAVTLAQSRHWSFYLDGDPVYAWSCERPLQKSDGLNTLVLVRYFTVLLACDEIIILNRAMAPEQVRTYAGQITRLRTVEAGKEEGKSLMTISEQREKARLEEQVKKEAGIQEAIQNLPVSQEVFYVDNVKGDDANAGTQDKPFKTFAVAVKKLQAGATLRLVNNPEPYHDRFSISLLLGRPDHPILVDGQMSVLNGSNPIRTEDWQDLGNDLFRQEVPSSFFKIFSGSSFLLIDGRMQRMNMTSKQTRQPLPLPDKLQPGEWTYLQQEKSWIYLRLPEKKGIADVRVSFPVLWAGIELADCRNVIFANFIIENFRNDGVGLSGACRNVQFKNIISRYNGDDAVSAHDDVQCSFENCIFMGCGTGAAHATGTRTLHKNILILNSPGTPILMMGKTGEFEKMLLISGNNSTWRNGSQQSCYSVTDACFCAPQSDRKAVMSFDEKADIKFRNVKAWNYQFTGPVPAGLELLMGNSPPALKEGWIPAMLKDMKDVFKGEFPEAELKKVVDF